MSLKSDWWIQRMATRHGLIDPFVGAQVSQPGPSYGLSAYGYDFRLDRQFRHLALPPATPDAVLDPRAINPAWFMTTEADEWVIPPGSFVLARSLEYFRIPRDILALCTGKSTYARCGVLVNVTPLEPEWEGSLTVAVANTGPLPARIHAGAGIGQIVFLQADGVCRTSYRDKQGKYQGQQSITLARS